MEGCTRLLLALVLVSLSQPSRGETYLCSEVSSGIDWQYVRSGDGFTDVSSERFEIIFESDNYLQLNLAGTLPDNRCLLYTSPSPRDVEESRMPSSA